MPVDRLFYFFLCVTSCLLFYELLVSAVRAVTAVVERATLSVRRRGNLAWCRARRIAIRHVVRFVIISFMGQAISAVSTVVRTSRSRLAVPAFRGNSASGFFYFTIIAK